MNDESKIFGVSVRAFIAILVTMTICTMALMALKVTEPFYSISLFVIGFFFGQKTQSKTGGTT